MNRCSNFNEVLNNCDNQVLVRDLLNKNIPENIKIEITRLFNQEYEKKEFCNIKTSNTAY